jgi:1-aminocyclopropane-1-carboxylate deaminase
MPPKVAANIGQIWKLGGILLYYLYTVFQQVIHTINLQGVHVDVLRLDLGTPDGIGNKYFKLKYNLDHARQQNQHTLLSFGGAFSNHIQALSLLGSQHHFQTIGVIRGEDDANNPTLQFAREHGMQLHFVGREAYKSKDSADFIDELKQKFGDFYLIPEGGSNDLAVRGCMEILHGLEPNYTQVLLSCGTGATLAGVAATPTLTARVTGISVLKGIDQLTNQVTAFIPPDTNPAPWQILFDYHLGGYAKNSKDLANCMQFLQGIPDLTTDPVYTAKLFCAANHMISAGLLLPDDHILLIHTGGLQGIQGWKYRFPGYPY